MISQTADYALRAVVWLASHPDCSLTAQQIAESTGVPPGYLAKVLQGLSRAGVLHSQRGLGGGFVLARPTKDLSIWDIVQAADPIKRIRECPLAFEAHGKQLCALHRELDNVIALIEKRLSGRTIASLVKDAGASGPLCAHGPERKAKRRQPAKR